MVPSRSEAEAAASTRPDGEKMSGKSERELRTRTIILDAAQRTIEKHGTALMRQIIRESGLSLGTVYRYFRSRDHIIAELQIRWIEHLDKTFACSSLDPTERLVAVVDATCKSLDLAPEIARHTVHARQSGQPGVREACEALDQRTSHFLKGVIADDQGLVDQVYPTLRLAWYGAISLWAQHLMTTEDVRVELERTTRLLASGYPRRQVRLKRG